MDKSKDYLTLLFDSISYTGLRYSDKDKQQSFYQAFIGI